MTCFCVSHRVTCQRLISRFAARLALLLVIVSTQAAATQTGKAAPLQAAESLPSPGPSDSRSASPKSNGIQASDADKNKRTPDRNAGGGMRSILDSISDVLDQDSASESSSPDLEAGGRTLARLRIPADLILKTLEQDFTHRTPVQRTVLGTDSQGHALCQGAINGSFLPSTDSAKVECTIEGTLTSETRGRNGPAIIDSRAVTRYRANALIVFDGKSFYAEPVTVCGSTQLTITSVDSELPRLRGRIVRRVAARKAAESHQQAQEITCQLTLNDLQKRIGEELQSRIHSLNQRLAQRLTLLELLNRADAELQVSTTAEALHVDLVGTSTNPKGASLPQIATTGTAMELWIPVPSLTEATAGALALATLPELLANLFDERPQLSEMLNDRLEFDRHGEWLVIKLDDK